MPVAIRTPSYYGYGPYYQAERLEQENRRTALGMPAINPAALAAERYGEMSAYLGEARLARADVRADKELQMRERVEQRGERAAKVSGISSMAGFGLTAGKALGTALPAMGIGTAATAAVPAGGIITATGQATGTAIAASAGTGAWLGPIGLIIGGALGAIFSKK